MGVNFDCQDIVEGAPEREFFYFNIEGFLQEK